MFRILLIFCIALFTIQSAQSQCNQTTNLSNTIVSNTCPSGSVTYNLMYSSMVSAGNNSICYGYTITNANGTQTTTNIGPVNQSNSSNSNWTHQFNVTINCTQSITMFLNAWSNQNCGGMQCAAPRSRTLMIAPLPVDLVYFTGKKINEKNVLTWQTSNEVNNAGFNIQLSEDGDNFENIGFVKGAGQSLINRDYNYVHQTNHSKTLFYRLEQVDFDGQKNLSHVVQIKNNHQGNPFVIEMRNDRLYIESYEQARVQLYNALGHLIRQLDLQEGENIIETEDLPRGICFIQAGSHKTVPVFIP